MIFKLYYLDYDDHSKKYVRNVDDIHEHNVWAVSKLWGIPVAVVEESQQQPEDAGDYQEVTQ